MQGLEGGWGRGGAVEDAVEDGGVHEGAVEEEGVSGDGGGGGGHSAVLGVGV